LEWESISDSHLTVWTVKQDKRVRLPLSNPLIGGGVLRKCFEEIEYKDKKYCFPDWAEAAKDPKKRSRFSVYFNRFLGRLGIEGKSFHCFRHSFVSRVKAESYDSSLEKIASWVGHSRVETTKGYLHETS
jgi:integrase